jgi:hypothetical protein
MEKKQLKRWLKALEIAKILFEDEWYHTKYLEEIEQAIKQIMKKPTHIIKRGDPNASKGKVKIRASCYDKGNK